MTTRSASRFSRAARRALVGALTFGALLALGAGQSAAAPGACPKGKVTRITDGVRTCAGAGAFRQRANRLSPAVEAVQRALEGRPVTMRQKNGRVVPDQVPDRLAAAIAAGFGRKEAELTQAIRVARQASGDAVVVTEGPPATVTRNADGSVTAAGSLIASENGQSLTADISLTGRASGTLDIDLNFTLDGGKGGTSSRGLIVRGIDFAPRQSCPTAAGKISLDNAFSGTSRNAETFGGSRVKLGTVREATTLTVRSAANAQMGPDARLTPFTVTVSGTLDYSRTAQGLAFFSSRARAVGTGAMTATVNPVTGAVTGARVTTTTRTSGFSGASSDNEMDAVMRGILNDEAGRMLARMREVEKKARSGACTRIVLVPGSPAVLKPRASRVVEARLETAPDGVKVPVVRWGAVPAKGSVAPRSSRTAVPTFTVTGAGAGPTTAQVNLTAVSPAGISKATWVGNDAGFPPSFSGSVSYQSPGAGGLQSETWNGVVTYTGPSEQTNPDGSRSATYTLTSANIASHVGAGVCSWTSGPGGTIKFGDLEIRVSPAGAWTSAFVVDVEMPTVPFSCPPAPAQPGTPKAFLNTRTTAFALRPMPANGPITGTAVTDTSGTLGVPITATWNLTPG